MYVPLLSPSARVVTCWPDVARGQFFSAGFHNVHVTILRWCCVPRASAKFLPAGVNTTLIHCVRTLCFMSKALFSGSIFPGSPLHSGSRCCYIPCSHDIVWADIDFWWLRDSWILYDNSSDTHVQCPFGQMVPPQMFFHCDWCEAMYVFRDRCTVNQS